MGARNASTDDSEQAKRAGAVVVLVGYGYVGTRPRMVMAIVPGFVWLVSWLRGWSVAVLAGTFASSLPLVAFFYAQNLRV